ncbi:MAG TPA: hypothetical protein VHD83_13075 [Puia sp.]|nr:hypothetical protein [Puia sp.]
MKRFIRNFLYFLAPLLLLMAVCLFLPSTPRASKSLLFAEIKKDSLLQHVDSPRIIFVGGSNLSFGLNSQMIEDSLKLFPINTGVHFSLGLKFMMENTLLYVRKGDVVVLIPEYAHFTRDYDAGSEELLRSVMEVDRSKIKLLNTSQILHLIPFIPKYAFSKLLTTEYFHVGESDIYSVNSFNRYGDAYAHWNLKRRFFLTEKKTNGYLNPDVVEGIKKFAGVVKAKGAALFVSYPGLQDISYHNIAGLIAEVEKQYKREGYAILGAPERYMMPDSLMFNTPYHLDKTGVDYRTTLLIEDLRQALGQGSN